MVESGLELEMQALLSSLPHYPMVRQEPRPLSEQPLGSVLRALYQEYPLQLSPLLPPELNPQQVSELNLEWGLEAFGARRPCGWRPGEL